MVHRKQYPEEEAQDKKRMEDIKVFQAYQASIIPGHVKDRSMFTIALRIVAYLSLIITLVLAVITMFWSADMSHYETNRDMFYRYGFIWHPHLFCRCLLGITKR